jgi:hypothetical protein
MRASKPEESSRDAVLPIVHARATKCNDLILLPRKGRLVLDIHGKRTGNNIAARIAAQAQGGEVLVSATTAERIQKEFYWKTPANAC